MRTAFVAAHAVVAATLVDDTFEASHFPHDRSPLTLAGAGAIAVGLLLVAPKARSLVISLGAGIAAGGAAATLVAGAAWRDGVPNPLVRDGVAFNLADLAIAGGDTVLLAAALMHAWRHRDRLYEPV